MFHKSAAEKILCWPSILAGANVSFTTSVNPFKVDGSIGANLVDDAFMTMLFNFFVFSYFDNTKI